jgi:hypothetical protein
MLKTYDEFAGYVDELGFMTLSESPAGWPSLGAMTDEGQWFTDGPDDPWQWRVRIVEERRAAYAKIFFGMPSFISREWYPCFLAARRDGRSFEDVWDQGLMSGEAKRIYDLFLSRSLLATHEIKQLGGFEGKSKGRYESAMTALQTGMFITTSGMTRMTTLDGRPHSCPVTEYRSVENWAWEGAVEQAAKIGRQEAAGMITERLLKIMPGMKKQFTDKFTGT